MSVEALFQKNSKKRVLEETSVEEGLDAGSCLDDDEQQKVNDLIDQNQVVVFSKSYCPYCRQAKMALNSIENLEYKVVEMDDGQHEGWQAYIAETAKERATAAAQNNNTKSVPQIFVQQKYIGGAEDLADKFVDKSLAEMLGRAI